MEDMVLINMMAFAIVVCTGRTGYNLDGYGKDKMKAEAQER
jgi:hypothetical protein